MDEDETVWVELSIYLRFNEQIAKQEFLFDFDVHERSNGNVVLENKIDISGDSNV